MTNEWSPLFLSNCKLFWFLLHQIFNIKNAYSWCTCIGTHQIDFEQHSNYINNKERTYKILFIQKIKIIIRFIIFFFKNTVSAIFERCSYYQNYNFFIVVFTYTTVHGEILDLLQGVIDFFLCKANKYFIKRIMRIYITIFFLAMLQKWRGITTRERSYKRFVLSNANV